MSVLRLFAIALIFAGVSAAWMILGGTIWTRTETLDRKLSPEMRSQWGPKVLAQPSPWWSARSDGARDAAGSANPSASRISADIEHDPRRKGLLWYSTFTVKFSAEYEVPPAGASDASAAQAQNDGFFIFPLPAGVCRYDELSVSVDGEPRRVTDAHIAAARISVPLARDAGHTVSVAYTTFGQNVWLYAVGDAPAEHGCSESDETVFAGDGPLMKLNDFTLTITTDFADIDYPKGSTSPSAPASIEGDTATAVWKYASAMQRQPMGVVIPKPDNAGPVTSRMSFFAPVSLFFFLTVLFTVVVLKKIPLHPMHYLFIAAGFFAFHILLAYLVDKIPLHASFWISACVSVLLVVSYMRLVGGVKFAVIYVGSAQLVYLVGFSYAFFHVGWTGLTVVIVAVLTLFVLMQATGRINWNEVFKRRNNV